MLCPSPCPAVTCLGLNRWIPKIPGTPKLGQELLRLHPGIEFQFLFPSFLGSSGPTQTCELTLQLPEKTVTPCSLSPAADFFCASFSSHELSESGTPDSVPGPTHSRLSSHCENHNFHLHFRFTHISQDCALNLPKKRSHAVREAVAI